ncbi:hypothetical protein K504DRAFT_412586 [Pleomassaria siparia CBS 279.74]|uniref:Acyltransferase 3 domain-containing protein n=1 Tax=Pleomassaria siparia CBS 279.74 TaxID=1314801 RepID=A0A6G1K236_9PLEO|nr:hypothetical protein K504DRAFT_412586 [Pleomassaria siparia CBS 279.74]
MRGYASMCVFTAHFINPIYPHWSHGFWAQNGMADDWSLPIIRLLYSGKPCVLVFYVLSGFSISLKPLRLARQGQNNKEAYNALFTTLVSSTFRRALRLYLPCLALMLIILLLIFLGCYDHAVAMAEVCLGCTYNWPFQGGIIPVPLVFESRMKQILHLNRYFWRWSDILNARVRVRDMPYAVQLWSIPVELKCSFIAWLAVLGLAKTRPSIRISVLVAICTQLFARQNEHPALFIFGVILAELFLIRIQEPQRMPVATQNSKARTLPICKNHTEASQRKNFESRWRKLTDTVMFVFGLHLLSYPRVGGSTALGWSLLFRLGSLFTDLPVDPHKERYQNMFTCTGAMLVVYAVSQSPVFLQRMFHTPLAKYLGKISFAVYCVHSSLFSLVGFPSVVFWWRVGAGYNVGVALSFIMLLVLTVCAADIFYRAVDEPSVRLAKWLENKCTETALDDSAFKDGRKG